jgi:hypothetical protein
MTERKFQGMISDLLGSEACPRYRAGLFSALRDIGDPCPLEQAISVDDVRYAEGHAAGKKLQELFLRLNGKTDDETVVAEICRLVECDTERVPIAVLNKTPWEGNHRTRAAFNALLGVAL